MKILFLNSFDDPADGGGAEVTIWTLIRALTEQGHECVILSMHAADGLNSTEREGVRIWRAGIRNLYWPSKERPASSLARLAWHAIDVYSPLMQSHLQEVLRLEQPDIVSAHNLPGWSARAWSTLHDGGYPFIQVLHDQYAICPRTSMFKEGHNCQKQCAACRFLRLPYRGWSNRPSAVVGVSQFVLDWHLTQGYFKEVPVKRVINNTRSSAQLQLDTPVEPHSGTRFGFIGKLDPSKGIEVLLQAFKDLDQEDAELWVAGGGDSTYVDCLKRNTSDRRVRFMGHVPQRDFYPRIDVVATPSLWNDTFPGVVFEAFAYQKPVLGSNRGGIPEMIQHGRNGFLFNPDEPSELTSLLAHLAQDSDLCRRMGRAAHASSAPFLDTSAWSSAYLNLYSEILGRSSVTRQ